MPLTYNQPKRKPDYSPLQSLLSRTGQKLPIPDQPAPFGPQGDTRGLFTPKQLDSARPMFGPQGATTADDHAFLNWRAGQQRSGMSQPAGQLTFTAGRGVGLVNPVELAPANRNMGMGLLSLQLQNQRLNRPAANTQSQPSLSERFAANRPAVNPVGIGGNRINPSADAQIAHDKLVTPGNSYNAQLPGYPVGLAARMRTPAPPPVQGNTPANIATANAGLSAKGFEQDSKGTWRRSPGYASTMTPPDAKPASLAARLTSSPATPTAAPASPLAAALGSYKQRVAERKGRVADREMAKGEQRTLRLEARRNPQVAQDVFDRNSAMGLQGLINKGQVGVAEARGRADAAKTEAGAKRDSLAALVGLVQGGVPLDKAQQMVGAQGGGNAPAASQSAAPIPSAANTPAAAPEVTERLRAAAATGNADGIRAELVRIGVTDRGQQNKIIGDVMGNPNAGKAIWEQPVGLGASGLMDMFRRYQRIIHGLPLE